MKKQNGITLIALVITIIVMLILVGVSVTVALNGGLFTTAKEAAEGTASKRNEELELSSGKVEINGEWYNSIDEYVKGSENGAGGEYEAISVETDCVGYYVDLGGEEGPEGVVYIDIANTESGSWNGYSYTITNQTEGLKEYYVSSEEDYEGAFGTKPVLSLIPGSTGTERFYVMALEDEKTDANTTFYWYYNALDEDTYEGKITDYATVTSTGIGAGKTNTETMIAKWNAEAYGEKNDRDMWGLVKDGWYIPSKDEWAAFGSTMEITSSNYTTKGLSFFYWSSSLGGSDFAWYVDFGNDRINDRSVDSGSCVRLGTTF